jgi:cAMP phosphodiesterase
MKEALRTIQTLRNELNEVNLLNAKLLYVNKIFKAKNLTESQKLQVIASFDKATNVKEAKVVFESLNNTLTTAPAKKAIKESLGFASKAMGVAPKKTIVESNDVIARMQKLANIIK